MPKVPPAPPTFSTTSVWPSVRDIWSPTRRGTTSVGPPAANGTITVIGLFGYWGAAGALCYESTSRLPAIRRQISGLGFLPPTRRRDDGRRAPFAQVRLAASVLVRAATRWPPKTASPRAMISGPPARRVLAPRSQARRRELCRPRARARCRQRRRRHRLDAARDDSARRHAAGAGLERPTRSWCKARRSPTLP